MRRWFAGRTPDLELDRDDNYFEVGAIDSFSVIELIENVENRFSIRFTEQDFQDRRFVTLSGLAELIREKRGD
nr:acyl carrier protein [Candidatus Thiosymbion oneisti]